MPSPRRIFRHATTAQLQEIIASGIDSAIYGQFTSMSGGGKSHTSKFMDLEDMLFEANFELGCRYGTNPPQKVYQDLTGNCNPNLIVNPTV